MWRLIFLTKTIILTSPNGDKGDLRLWNNGIHIPSISDSHGASDNSGLKTEKVTDTKDIHKTGLKFCNFCDFKTFWFSSLLRHKKSHTNRRVPCPTCPDKSYQTNSDLQEHMVSQYCRNKMFTLFYHTLYMSHVMRKAVFAICEQQRPRSACTSAQSDQVLCFSLPR